MSNTMEKVAIIGSGLIGRSWSMLFASVGYKISLYDIDKTQIESALREIEVQMKVLENEGMLRGNLSSDEQISCIKGSLTLEEALENAIFILECVPENLDLKKKVWEDIDHLIKNDTILCSSSSTLLPSLISSNLSNRKNFMVSHPINPPYFIPLIELIPAPWTTLETIIKTRNIMKKLGQSPITLTREIEGFALNRIQYAILNETWNLVADGIINVKDVDKVMTDGLGIRYAFLGSLETSHLNADGFSDYCEKYGKKIYDVSKTFGPIPKFESGVLEKIQKELEEEIPIDKLEEKRKWRDFCIWKLGQLKKEMSLD